MAQDGVTCRPYAVPSEVYEALLVVNNRYADSNMTLLQAQELVKGMIVLEVGFPACVPCRKMQEAIEEADLPFLWEMECVQYYRLNILEDTKKEWGPSLADWIRDIAKTSSVPLLFVIQDGKVMAMSKGYKASEKKSFISKIKEVTLP